VRNQQRQIEILVVSSDIGSPLAFFKYVYLENENSHKDLSKTRIETLILDFSRSNV